MLNNGVVSVKQWNWLPVARAGWVALILGMVGLMTIVSPLEYRYITTPCLACDSPALTPPLLAELSQVGLSLQAYALIYILEEYLFTLVWWVPALLVFLHHPSGTMELLVAYMLALFGYAFVAPTDLLPHQGLLFILSADVLPSVALMLILLFFFVFPDGRFAPRWTWYAYLAFVVYLTIWMPFRVWIQVEYQYIPQLVFLVLGVIAQIGRYRRNPDKLQRQQVKWVVYGISVSIFIFTLFGILNELLPADFYRHIVVQMIANPLVYLAMSLIPASIGIAILRHRLWDIDVVIRKTLVYTLLTTGLVLVFFGSVILLQSVFLALTGSTRSDAGNAISTLVIASLFTPLRRRIQAAIDRRFYRQKLDAEQTLAGLQPVLQEEVGVEKLEEKVVGVVGRIFQPESVSIWLRAAQPGPAARSERPD